MPLRRAAVEATRLSPEQLHTACDAEFGTAATTADLDDLDKPLGQERAVEALRFGIEMRASGYGIFVLGPHGTGRATLVKSFLQAHAASQPVAQDVCYVQNFEDASRPVLLIVPAGTGIALRKAIEQLTEEFRLAIPGVFESEPYRNRRQAIEAELKERREHLLETFRLHAEQKGFAFAAGPNGFVFAPRRGDELLAHEAFHALPEAERDRLKREMGALGNELKEMMRPLPQWESDSRARIRALDREMTTEAIAHLIDALRARYRGLSQVIAFLDALQRDVIEHASEFLAGEQELTMFATVIDEDGRRQRLRPWAENGMVGARRVIHASLAGDRGRLFLHGIAAALQKPNAP